MKSVIGTQQVTVSTEQISRLLVGGSFHALILLFRAGKAITITHQGNREHKEKVSDLVDNRLLDQHDKVVTIVPAISRHEVEGMEYTFVVLASAALAAALKPQQVVDTVNMALKVGYKLAYHGEADCMRVEGQQNCFGQ